MVLTVKVMSEMELGTFGSILKFAMELENDAIEFYKSMSPHVSDQKMADFFNELVIRGEKRIKTLERVRRENTTEMILEPITGFDSEEYTLSEEEQSSKSDEILRKQANEIETKLESFYTTAAKKIEFLSEAAYAFELLAEKNTETKKNLAT